MLNLEKLEASKAVVLNLAKTKGLSGQVAQVAVCMDYSGSMGHLYENGHVQKVLERLIPIAMAFDDNEEMEFYRFDNGVKRIDSVNLQNLQGFIGSKVYTNSGRDMGGTEYAPAINQIVKDYTTQHSGGLKSLFSGTKTIGKLQYPIYVIFITDGQNSDRDAATQAIRAAANHGIFFQFVGLGGASFTYLEGLDNLSGRKLDNANFFQISERDMLQQDDEWFYGKLLAEFPTWLPQAVAAGMVR